MTESRKIIAARELKMDALDLGDFINECLDGHMPKESNPVLYVMSEDGQLFGRANLRENTLTDGSKTYDLVLIPFKP